MHIVQIASGWRYLSLIAGACALISAPALAQNSVRDFDCSDLELEYRYDPDLTRAENIARMDQHFFESLEKFEHCMAQAANGGADSGGAAGLSGSSQGGSSQGGAAGDGSANDLAGDLTGTEAESAAGTAGAAGDYSAPSSDLAGDEKRPETIQEAALSAADSDFEKDLGSTSAQGSGSPPVSNGAVPEDIPSADNDSVLEAQIRRAAMEEEDPEIRARLWDEYRKFKGLPTPGAGG